MGTVGGLERLVRARGGGLAYYSCYFTSLALLGLRDCATMVAAASFALLGFLSHAMLYYYAGHE